MTKVNELVQFGQNLDFKIGNDHEIKSYERGVYQSEAIGAYLWEK